MKENKQSLNLEDKSENLQLIIIIITFSLYTRFPRTHTFSL